MRKLFLLLILVFCVNAYQSYSQGTAKFNPNIERLKVDPKYKYIPKPIKLNSRAGDTACSVVDINMPFNYLVWGDAQSYNLNGNWYATSPDPLTTLISSNKVPGNDGRKFSVTQIYDTMITRVFGLSSFDKINKATSYLKLDSLTIFGSLQVDDTSDLRSLVGDSLIISVFLSNNGVIGTKLFDSIYADTFKLKKFVFQKGFVGSRSINFKHTFNKGESFSIKMQYKTTKVDQGYSICYAYVDSCNTVTFNGNQLSSPAIRNSIYPGLAISEDIDSTSPSNANIVNSTNNFGYFGLGFPANCSYIYEQVYYIIPQVIVCKELQGSIALSKDRPCYKDQLTAYAVISGGKPPYTYSWTSTGGVVLSATNLDSANFTMNKSGNFNVNVTVTDAGTNTISLTRNIANYTPTFTAFTLTPNKTVLSGCADTIQIAVPSTTSTTYEWTGAGSSSTRTVTAKAAGTYNIKTTFTPSGCTYDSSISITSSYIFPTLDFTYTPATNICQNKDVNFKVTPAATRTGWTYSWKDGATPFTNSPGTDIIQVFTTAGSKTIYLNADSGTCKATQVSKTLTVIASTVSPCKSSISESISDNIKVYPNPVRNGEVFIQNELNSLLSIRVTDMLGKVITTDKIAGNKTNPIDLSNAPNGVYFIELEGKNDRTIKKIIVDKQ